MVTARVARRPPGIRARSACCSWWAVAGRRARCPSGRASIRSFRWDGVRFQTFAAGEEWPELCPARVPRDPHAILLGGDLDASAERAARGSSHAPEALASTVVLMGRQASAAASAREWIDASAAVGSPLRPVVSRIHNPAPRRSRAGVLREPLLSATRRVGGVEFSFRDVGPFTGRHGSGLALSLRLAALAMTLSRAPSGIVPAHVGTRSGRRPFMAPIILCSIAAVGILLERLWTLQRKRVLPEELIEKLSSFAEGGPGHPEDHQGARRKTRRWAGVLAAAPGQSRSRPRRS